MLLLACNSLLVSCFTGNQEDTKVQKNFTQLSPEESGIDFQNNLTENDSINYKWELLPESTDLGDGGDFEKRPKAIDMRVINSTNGELKFKAPEVKGAYRLFGYVDDGPEKAATSNIPFRLN